MSYSSKATPFQLEAIYLILKRLGCRNVRDLYDYKLLAHFLSFNNTSFNEHYLRAMCRLHDGNIGEHR
jgi:hypothetical protein